MKRRFGVGDIIKDTFNNYWFIYRKANFSLLGRTKKVFRCKGKDGAILSLSTENDKYYEKTISLSAFKKLTEQKKIILIFKHPEIFEFIKNIKK